MTSAVWLSLQPCFAAGSARDEKALLRVYVALDDTWSMARRVGRVARMDYAAAAVERWAAALDLSSSPTVELLAASDHLDPAGSFALHSQADRTALIDAVHGVQPKQNTRTNFGAIDAALAEIVRRDTAAGEDFALILLTDAISDTPGSDLRADDIGDRTVNLGGVSAVILGPVPAEGALARHGTPARREAVRSRRRGKPSSALRALRQGLVRLRGREVITGTPAARLFGGWDPLRTTLDVDNTAGVARLVRFDAVAPAGGTAIVSPNPVVLPAGGSATVTLELSAPESVQGPLVVIGHLPDGRSVRHTAHVQLTPGTWMAGNVLFLALLVVAAAASLTGCARWMRRPVRVGDHADADQQAALRIGDSVALDTFAPGATGTLRRGWLGYQIVADGEPLSVSGRSVPAGGRSRYRLGEDVRVGGRTLAIFRIDPPTSAVGADEFSFGLVDGRASGGLR